MRRFQWAVIALWISVSGAAWADPPDLCCLADVTGDGVVDIEDWEHCAFHQPPPWPPLPECDIDGNGGVGLSDFQIMTGCWGVTCAAGVPSLTPGGAGLAAGIMVGTAAWAYRRRRHNG